jgi:hypothetical protein
LLGLSLSVFTAWAQEPGKVAPNSDARREFWFRNIQSKVGNGSMPHYADSASGLESMMRDMLEASKRRDTATLTQYVSSLALPDSESWFNAHFARENCDIRQLAANDCLGPRLALTYSATANTLDTAASKTFEDLIDESLTNFEAVNYADLCAYNVRIVPAGKLLSQLSTTPIITSMQSALGQHGESVFMVWAYNENEETMIGFFVYSQGSFRYLGNPHPASTEEFASKTAPHERPPSDDLTFEIISQPQVIVDSQAVQHEVTLHVLIDATGKLQEATYVRGPLAEKDEAIRAAKQHLFVQPFNLFGLKFATDGCINVVLSGASARIDSFSSSPRLNTATKQ